jgi:hypothetical protein
MKRPGSEKTKNFVVYGDHFSVAGAVKSRMSRIFSLVDETKKCIRKFSVERYSKMIT